MSFRIGIVGLCTSHPENWVPIIRDLTKEKLIDAEVTACWDPAETRPEGFAKEFAKKFDIPNPIDNLNDMIDLVDGVIIHTANWDRHIEQAKPFIEADKSILIDKPIVGNLKDANQLIEWARLGKRITGGSSLRFAKEVKDFLSKPIEERGEVHTAYAGCGTDEFNYGIHAYALISGLLGPGIRSVRYLGVSKQKQIMITWDDGKIGFVTVGKQNWIPFHLTAITDKLATQITTDNSIIYRTLLENILPYFTGKTDTPPLPIETLLEPELAAIAARLSWMNHGAEIFLTDLRIDDPGYDGTQFALEYRLARLGK